jgi:hypothetical protein
VKNFYNALSYVDKLLYAPNNLTITAIQEEAQNCEYSAGIFQLNSKSIRFRVAKITPTKIGQFVAFWEKDQDNKNQAFSYEKATDLKQPLQKKKWQLGFILDGKFLLANKLSKHRNGN